MIIVLVLTTTIIINSGKIFDYQISFIIGFTIIFAEVILSSILLWSYGTLEKFDEVDK